MRRIEWLGSVLVVTCGVGAGLWANGFVEARARLDAPAQGDGTVAFEENLGQTDDAVRFLARGQRYATFLTADALTVARGGSAPLTTRFLGANDVTPVEGDAQLPGVVNVFRGDDPDQWVTGAERFARVRYDGLYDGIDLVCYGDEGLVEYDFEVAPGADASLVRLGFDEGVVPSVDEDGNLLLSRDGDDVIHQRPFAYQRVGDEAIPVPATFEVYDDGSVGFAVAAHDATRPLVIDPTIRYSTFLGGSDGDEAHGIWVAPDGSRYVAGRTASPDFPSADGAAADFDIFCSKFAPDGTTLEFTTLVGSPGEESSAGLVVNPDTGEIFLAGQARAAGYPTASAFQSGFGGIGPSESEFFQFGDAVLTKLSPDGDEILFSTYLGGEFGELCHDITMGPDGSVAICGRTDSADFPTRNALFERPGDEPSGPADAWVAKFDASGDVVFSSYMGGAFPTGTSQDALEHFTGAVMDAKGHVWLCGFSNSDDFPTTQRIPISLGFNDVNITLTLPDGRVLRPNRPNWDGGNSLHDGILVQIDKLGRKVRYSRFFGGLEDDFATDIALDAKGNIHLTGATRSGGEGGFPVTVNGFQVLPGGGQDAFLLILDKRGRKIRYGSLLGGERSENGTVDGRVVVDALGRVHVTGRASSESEVTFPLTEDAVDTEARSFEAFFTTFTPLGADGVQFSTLFGGRFTDSASAIAVDSRGLVHIAGQSLSGDLTTTEDALQRGYGGSGDLGTGDAFIATFDVDVEAAAVGRAKVRKKTNFGTRRVGQTRVKKIVLKNADPAGRPVLIDVGEVAAPFRLISGGGRFLLPRRSKHIVLVEFAPDAPGTFESDLEITTTSPDVPTLLTVLKGKAK